jgi:hypothetical protein
MNKLGSVLFVIAFVSSTFAVEARKITVIKSTLQSGTSVMVEINEGGKPKDMFCDLSIHPCQRLAPGDYIMVSSAKGMYQDCIDDVDVYATGADRSKTEPLGTYCLLQ